MKVISLILTCLLSINFSATASNIQDNSFKYVRQYCTENCNFVLENRILSVSNRTWLSMDNLIKQSNKNNYVDGNPVNFYDPEAKDKKLVWDEQTIIAVSIGGIIASGFIGVVTYAWFDLIKNIVKIYQDNKFKKNVDIVLNYNKLFETYIKEKVNKYAAKLSSQKNSTDETINMNSTDETINMKVSNKFGQDEIAAANRDHLFQKDENGSYEHLKTHKSLDYLIKYDHSVVEIKYDSLKGKSNNDIRFAYKMNEHEEKEMSFYRTYWIYKDSTVKK